jgi:hypothetical protein
MEATKRIHPKLSSDPLVRLRARLEELDGRIADLNRRQRQNGDVLAGRLMQTLRVEQGKIRAALKGWSTGGRSTEGRSATTPETIHLTSTPSASR